MQTLLLLHAAVTFALVGLIWVVQLAIYPLFEKVGASAFRVYHEAYARRISIVVAPLMGVELLTGIRLMSQVEPGASMAVPWTAFILIVLIWGVTAAVSVPLHNKLATRFDPRVARLLVATNWIRTGAWTARGLLVGSMVLDAVGGGG